MNQKTLQWKILIIIINAPMKLYINITCIALSGHNYFLIFPYNDWPTRKFNTPCVHWCVGCWFSGEYVVTFCTIWDVKATNARLLNTDFVVSDPTVMIKHVVCSLLHFYWFPHNIIAGQCEPLHCEYNYSIQFSEVGKRCSIRNRRFCCEG